MGKSGEEGRGNIRHRSVKETFRRAFDSGTAKEGPGDKTPGKEKGRRERVGSLCMKLG